MEYFRTGTLCEDMNNFLNDMKNSCSSEEHDLSKKNDVIHVSSKMHNGLVGNHPKLERFLAKSQTYKKNGPGG